MLLLLFFLACCVVRPVRINPPPGLWFDEAINGLNALSILHEQPIRVYFDNREYFGGEIRNGQEPLYHYIVALWLRLKRNQEPEIRKAYQAAWIRKASEFVGYLTLLVFFAMVLSIWGGLVEGRALLALFLLAFFRWHVHFSRIGFRTILVPLFACLFFWLWWRGVEKGKRASLVASGVFLGLGFYTYPAFQLVVAAWLSWVVWRWIFEKERRRQLVISTVVAGVIALVVIAPLLHYFATHPDVVSGRTSSLSIFKQPGRSGWELLGQNIWDNIHHFWWKGDHVAKHNVPYMPVFDPLTGSVFALGLIVTVAGARRDSRNVLLLLWIFWVSLASVLSYGAPNLLRTLGMVPAVILVLTKGYIWIYQKIEKRFSKNFAAVVLLVLSFWFAGIETYRYHWVWRHDPKVLPQVLKEFNVMHHDVAEAVAIGAFGREVHIVPEVRVHPTIQFLLYGFDVRDLVVPDSLVRRGEDDRDRFLIYGIWTIPDKNGRDVFRILYPNAPVLGRSNSGGKLRWTSPDRAQPLEYPLKAIMIPSHQLKSLEEIRKAVLGGQASPNE